MPIYVIRLPRSGRQSRDLFWREGEEFSGWTDLPSATRFDSKASLPKLSVGVVVTLGEAAADLRV